MIPRKGQSLGGGPTQVIQTDHWEATKEADGWLLLVPAAVYGNAGGEVWEYGRVCSEEAKYGRVIHLDAANYVPMQGYGSDVKGVGI